MTPYFQSMIRAYRIAVDFARTNDISLTTIHPAAVYGGRNTGDGITDYMENLVSRNWHRLPFISQSSFPVVHVDTLTDAIVEALKKPGAYIVSDQMTSLRDIAQTMRKQTWSYIPLTVPLWFAMAGIYLIEAIARIIKVKPFASAVQMAFLTKGWQPNAGRAIAVLAWKPMPLEEGIRRFLAARRSAHADSSTALPVKGLERVRLIAGLELMTAAGLFLYWILYFTVGVAPENPPSGHFVCRRSHSCCASRESRDLAASPRSDPARAGPRAVPGLLGGTAVPRRIGHQLQPAARDLSDPFREHVHGGGDQHLVPGVRLPAGVRVRIRCLPAILTERARYRRTPMKFGLRYCNTGRYVDPKEAIALAQAAEAAGFESLWTVEHTIVPAGYKSAYPYDSSGKLAGGRNDIPLPDPLIWMAFVAAATTRIKLATGILILPQHNPVIAAKQIATLDHLSGGRILLGIGVGWLRGGVRGARRSVRGARRPHRRVHRGHARAVVGRQADLQGPLRCLRGRLLPAAAGEQVGADHRRRPFGGRRPPRGPARRRLLPGARRTGGADRDRAQGSGGGRARSRRARDHREPAGRSGRP